MALKNKKKRIILIILLALVLMGAILAISVFVEREYFSAEDFGIEAVISDTDYNRNGTDDYRDILIGARLDAENRPSYNGSYFEGGYPPDDIGVCTDVVWRAFKNAGYCLKDMVANDISAYPDDYPSAAEPDSNIDFRRVPNLHVFFEKYAVSLSTNPNDITEWQPGDIVIFGSDQHIGIISDRHSKSGRAYVIHNSGQPHREEDLFRFWFARKSVTAHYRFDASQIPESVLVPWSE